MNIDGIIRKLDLPGGSDGVKSRANELLRRANNRFGVRGPGQNGICKPAVCVELACGMCGRVVDQKRLIGMSGVQKKSYLLVLDLLKSIQCCVLIHQIPVLSSGRHRLCPAYGKGGHRLLFFDSTGNVKDFGIRLPPWVCIPHFQQLFHSTDRCYQQGSPGATNLLC